MHTQDVHTCTQPFKTSQQLVVEGASVKRKKTWEVNNERERERERGQKDKERKGIKKEKGKSKESDTFKVKSTRGRRDPFSALRDIFWWGGRNSPIVLFFFVFIFSLCFFLLYTALTKYIRAIFNLMTVRTNLHRKKERKKEKGRRVVERGREKSGNN